MNSLQNYTIKKLLPQDILTNWPLESNSRFKNYKNLATSLFYHGGGLLFLNNFIEKMAYQDQFIITDHIYYLNPPYAFQIDEIPYTILVAGAVKHFLLTQNIMTPSYWGIVLDQLLCPSGHVHLLETLKEANFLTLYPADIKLGFLARLKRLMEITNDCFFLLNSEIKDSTIFFNILTFVGVKQEKALQLADNYIATGSLQEIITYLEFQYKNISKTI